MNTKTKITITAFAVATIMLLLFEFRQTVSITAILITLVVVIALYRILPSRFNPNFFVLEIMLGTGFALALITQNFLGEIPKWTIWAWLGLSVVMSAIGPLPFLKKFSANSFH